MDVDPMSETLELVPARVRWKRAVDLLWREVIWLRRQRLEAREQDRARRRLKNLRRIVRKALAEYHASTFLAVAPRPTEQRGEVSSASSPR
jgi:hypothetical protein